MSNNVLRIEFVYEGGDASSIRDVHLETFTGREGVEVRHKSIIPETFGKTELIQYDSVPEDWPIEADNLRYKRGEDIVDLAQSPIVSYHIRDVQYLHGGEDHFADVSETEPVEQLIEVIRAGYNATTNSQIAVYALAPDKPPSRRLPPISAESVATDQYEYLSWLTIFPPAMVERIGRERLLDAPAWHVEELDDDAVLLVCGPAKEWRQSTKTVAEYLGMESY